MVYIIEIKEKNMKYKTNNTKIRRKKGHFKQNLEEN